MKFGVFLPNGSNGYLISKAIPPLGNPFDRRGLFPACHWGLSRGGTLQTGTHDPVCLLG